MNTKQVKKMIASYIESEQMGINEHNSIAAILSHLDGKPLNGVTLNAKRLNGLTFMPKYGMFYIKGFGEHLVGYDSNPNISVAKFEEFDACYGKAAVERVNQLNRLDIAKVVKLFSAIEKHFNELRYLFGDIENENLGSFHNPIFYNLLNEIHPSGSKNVRLTDFYHLRKTR